VRVIDTYRTVLSLAYSPCGRFLYSAGWQHVSRWNVHSGKEVSIHSDTTATYLRNIVLSPSGELIAWEDLARQRIHGRFLSRSSRRGTWEWPAPVTLSKQQSWTFLANDTFVNHTGPLATDQEGTVVAYSIRSQLYSALLPRTGNQGPLLGPGPKGMGGVLNARPDLISEQPVSCFGFASHDLLWWHSNGTLFLRDMTAGEIRQLSQLDRLPVAVTPDGRTGIAISQREVLLLDIPTGLVRERFNWDVGTVEAVAIAPDGLTAAVAGWAGGIAVFDLDG
jgi:WD40 repeat protein